MKIRRTARNRVPVITNADQWISQHAEGMVSYKIIKYKGNKIVLVSPNLQDKKQYTSQIAQYWPTIFTGD